MLFTSNSNCSSLLNSSHRNSSFWHILFLTLIALSANVSQAKTESDSDKSPISQPLIAANNVGARTIFGDINSKQTEAIPNGTYRITSKYSGKALEVSNRSLANGASIRQSNYVSGNNQQLIVESLGDGTFKLTALSSGKVIDGSDASSQNAANIYQWSYLGGDNQKWRIEPVGNGYYKVIAKQSGKALDISRGFSRNRAAVTQSAETGGDNQLWQFNLVVEPGRSPYVPVRYRLVFSDEFGETELNTSKWFTRYIYNGGYQDFLNNEEERYRENGNHVMSGSSLRLTAKLDQSGGTRYTSGMIRSKTTFKYGYFEGRFKMPKGKGIWPAFWLNSDASPTGELSWPPEIDIFEYVVNGTTEHPNMIHTSVIDHGQQGSTVLDKDPAFNIQWNYYAAPYDFSDDWHVIGLLWNTDDTVTTYIDGKMIVKRSTKWVKDSGADAPNAHVLVNFALGDSWAGPVDESQLPSFLDIDYIRVYQRWKANDMGTTTIGQDLCPKRGC